MNFLQLTDVKVICGVRLFLVQILTDDISWQLWDTTKRSRLHQNCTESLNM